MIFSVAKSFSEKGQALLEGLFMLTVFPLTYLFTVLCLRIALTLWVHHQTHSLGICLIDGRTETLCRREIINKTMAWLPWTRTTDFRVDRFENKIKITARWQWPTPFKPIGLSFTSPDYEQISVVLPATYTAPTAKDILVGSVTETGREGGFVLMGWATSGFLFLQGIAVVLLMCLAINFHLRLQYRCRDSALAAQENLATQLNSMDRLNTTVQSATTAYRAALAAQTLPPVSPVARAAAQALLVVKRKLNLQQERLESNVQTSLPLRKPNAAVKITHELRRDFQFIGLGAVNLDMDRSRPRRLFNHVRLDEHSRLFVSRPDLPLRTQLSWTWNFSPHNAILDSTLNFLRHALSQRKIYERVRADGGFHVLRGQCQSYVAKGSEGKWQAYLGRPTIAGKVLWK